MAAEEGDGEQSGRVKLGSSGFCIEKSAAAAAAVTRRLIR